MYIAFFDLFTDSEKDPRPFKPAEGKFVLLSLILFFAFVAVEEYYIKEIDLLQVGNTMLWYHGPSFVAK